MHMVLAYALPLTLRNAWTCMAQVKDTSALAGASQDDGRNPTPSSRPPVEPGNLLTAAADHLRSKDAQRKGQQRDQIPEDAGQIPGKGPLAHKNDVSRLGIGENLSPDAVGVSVLQPAGQGQKNHGGKCLGHLPMAEGGPGSVHPISSFPENSVNSISLERSTSHIPGAVSSVISAFNGSGYISADLYKEC